MVKVTEWLNVDYSLNYNKLYSYIDAQKRSDITYWRHFANAFAFLKRNQTVSLTAEYYRHQEQPYLFVDASYELSIAKPKLDFELRWNNIFNSKSMFPIIREPSQCRKQSISCARWRLPSR